MQSEKYNSERDVYIFYITIILLPGAYSQAISKMISYTEKSYGKYTVTAEMCMVVCTYAKYGIMSTC